MPSFITQRNCPWRAICALLLGLALANPGPLLAGQVTVAAAASLTDVISHLAQQYQQAQPQVQIKTSFAGSSTLAKQIVQGAPVDLFIAADSDWADYVEQQQKLDPSSRVDLLSNQLVLIAPASTGTSKLDISLSRQFDLPGAMPGKICTGDPDYVPVGKYARQALVYYGWWDSLQGRLVGTEDVRSALAFVARAECALGIVYVTDAALSNRVKILARFPQESHQPIVYPGGLTPKASAEAADFWQFLQSPQAAEVFSAYGFSLPRGASQ